MSTIRTVILCAIGTLAGCWLTNAEVAAKYAESIETGDTGVEEGAAAEQ
jgi:hypothetical protein